MFSGFSNHFRRSNLLLIAFNHRLNKTAGYQRRISCLLIFWRRLLKSSKRFFFQKKLLFSSYFLTFRIFKTFAFFRKKNINRAEKTFLGINTIFYAFCSKFATFIGFQKNRVSTQKTHLFFQKKFNSWTFWEVLLFQSNSTTVRWKHNFTFRLQQKFRFERLTRTQLPKIGWKK